ncbi:MAG: hypothetical protein P8J33_09880 [Pirellulaceae bacterium]|nr:hypothetical protein [Pirellulaceae bacterium]
MAHLEIEIEFTQVEKKFRTGEQVSGVVRVRANKKLKCRSIQLVAFWETHGAGDTTRENYHQEILRTGDFAEGETGEFTFNFAPPNHPITYHGPLVNVDHYVFVRADTPWNRDQQWKADFQLQVGTEAPQPTSEVTESEKRLSRLEKYKWIVAIFLILTALALALITGSGWWLFLAIPALLVIVPAIRKRIARRRLGEIKWITPSNGHPRESLRSHLKIGPLGSVRIKEIGLQLSGIETASSTHPSNEHSHLLHQQSLKLAKNPVTKRGEVLEFPSEMVLPVTEAWSIDLPGNRICWSLNVVISLAGWPDYVENRIIQVQDRVSDTAENSAPKTSNRLLPPAPPETG